MDEAIENAGGRRVANMPLAVTLALNDQLLADHAPDHLVGPRRSTAGARPLVAEQFGAG
jgi:hypothetical protein